MYPIVPEERDAFSYKLRRSNSLPLLCKGPKEQDMMSSQSASRATPKLFLFYCFFTAIHDLACADPPYNICSTNTNYAVGSPFEKNLNALLSSLSSNASVSKFYNTSAGLDLETVYGLYLCLDYDIIENCRNCIATATQDIKKLCPNSKEAIVWEETCQLRYSNENFFGQLDVSGNDGLDNKLNYSEPAVLTSSLNGTLSNLTKQAAFDPSAYMYATGKVAFTDTDTLYVLVQCTRDLSAEDCNTCLQTAKTNISSCCYLSIGARLLSRSCYLRYELYAFYEGKNGTSVSAGNGKAGKGSQRKTWVIVIIAIVLACLALVILGLCICFLVMRNGNQESDDEIREVQLNNTNIQEKNFEGRDDLKAQNIPYFDLESIHAATDNFSDSNFIGQGGFGPVYKGIMRDGKEVAVKRLSSSSEQGSIEFTNEVLLIMKLQHRNLVRLLGFCVDKEEKLVVYEYMPNSSLDVVLFDKRKRSQLNWSRRLNIINGIARGILYLHEDSRLRIIHRDLKASNVLLDSDMNPKISDFGMARIFAGNEGEANTVRIVGTYGYMAPEYAMEGLYSTKSDVFSFGVLLLEIITGRRNAGFHLSKRAPSLLAYAWKLRNEGQELELLDPLLTDTYCPDEFVRYVHIGLLCVQEDPCDRPTMSSVVLMLKSETVTLGQPERPAFSVGRFNEHCETTVFGCSINGLTISDVAPR